MKDVGNWSIYWRQKPDNIQMENFCSAGQRMFKSRSFSQSFVDLRDHLDDAIWPCLTITTQESFSLNHGD